MISGVLCVIIDHPYTTL